MQHNRNVAQKGVHSTLLPGTYTELSDQAYYKSTLDISWGAALSKSSWNELLETHSPSSVDQKPTINVQTMLCSLFSLLGPIPS